MAAGASCNAWLTPVTALHTTMKITRLLSFAVLATALLAPVARAQFVMGTLDTDITLAANRDDYVPSQKAIKAYIAAHTTDFDTLTVTASTGTLTIANLKTFTVSNTLTLAGTDGTTMTFPSTSATIARTDAANTFTGNQTFSGFVKSTSASAGIGYATGAGAAVTQATNRSTGVTATGVCGAITTATTSLAAGASATFTVTDTSVAIGDVVIVSIRSGATNKETRVAVTAVAAGSFDLTVHNQHTSTAETGAIVINFAVVKAVSS